MHLLRRLLLACAFGLAPGLGTAALAGQYTQNFNAFPVGTVALGDGSTLSSTSPGPAGSVQDGTLRELQLSQWDVPGTRAAFLLPDLDPGMPISAFTAAWVSPVYGDFPNAGDGFSFTFGSVRSLNLIDPAGLQEIGYGTGLTLSVHSGTGFPGIRLFANNVRVAGPIQPNPTATWGNFSSTRHTFVVHWSRDTGVTVLMDGNEIFSDVPVPGFTPAAGDSFVWAARSGSTHGQTFRLDLISVSTTPAPLEGVYSIGPTGNFPSLTTALAAATTRGLSDHTTFELQPTYDHTVETFPLTFAGLPTSASRTLTVRPGATATARVLTSAAAVTVDLDGARHVVLDGRPGGTGSAREWTLANTDPTGIAVRFINDASSNVLRHLVLQGIHSGTSGGIVTFAGTTGASGNDDNVIEHCNLGGGAGFPVNAIFSQGATGTEAQANSGNTVSGCNVFDFHSASLDAAGIRLGAGNSAWTFTGNSFYQTARRTPNSHVRALLLLCTDGNGFHIGGNFIGGSQSGAAGPAWSAEVGNFQGIHVVVGTTTPTHVYGNVIRNIAWASAETQDTLPGAWCGIYVGGGEVDIGTDAGNTIGSGSGTGSINFLFTPTVELNGVSATRSTLHGIGSASPGSVTIANNTIGSITTRTRDVQFTASAIGIRTTAGTNVIRSNLVGSLDTPNSIQTTSAGGRLPQNVVGIQSSSPDGARIASNTITRLHQGTATSFAPLKTYGIEVTDGVNSIVDNTVHDLSTRGGAGLAIAGIRIASPETGHEVSRNRVTALDHRSTSSTYATTVVGIDFTDTSTARTNECVGNLITSLASASPISDGSSLIAGLSLNAGHFIVRNNIIHLGLAANGANTGGAVVFEGIRDNRAANPTLIGAGSRKYHHNSVLIAGVQTSGASPSAAWRNYSTSQSAELLNNVFANIRANNGGTARHFAVRSGFGGLNPPGLLSDHNLFFAEGVGRWVAEHGGISRLTLADWQAATGRDSASQQGEPRFIAPLGTVDTLNLHMIDDSPARNAGIPIAGVSDDFDGEPRNPTHPDIGADEFLSAPRANTDTVERPFGRTVKIPVGRLLQNDTAEPGFTVSFLTAAATSGAGVPVVVQDGWILFAPDPTDTQTDSIPYQITDGIRVIWGTVRVVVGPQDEAPTQNLGTPRPLEAGGVLIPALGIPGREYQLQVTGSLVPPITWTPVGSSQFAAPNGQLYFVDPLPTSPAFYRVASFFRP